MIFMKFDSQENYCLFVLRYCTLERLYFCIFMKCAVKLGFTKSNSTFTVHLYMQISNFSPTNSIFEIKFKLCQQKQEFLYSHLAVCCLRALRNVAGWKSSERSTGSLSKEPWFICWFQRCTAKARAIKLRRYSIGSPGPSHIFCHMSGVCHSQPSHTHYC